ncbi:hypothetical protein AB0H73_34680 [Streptomyces olivoreticuli]
MSWSGHRKCGPLAAPHTAVPILMAALARTTRHQAADREQTGEVTPAPLPLLTRHG